MCGDDVVSIFVWLEASLDKLKGGVFVDVIGGWVDVEGGDGKIDGLGVSESCGGYA